TDPDLIYIRQKVHIHVETACPAGILVKMIPAVQINAGGGSVVIEDLSGPADGKAVEGAVVDIYAIDVEMPHHPVEAADVKIVEPAVRGGDDRQVTHAGIFS